MPELDERLRRALAHISDEAWDVARNERNLPRVQQRLRAARKRRASVGLAAVAAALALGWAVGRDPPATEPLARATGSSLPPSATAAPVLAAPTKPREPMQFADGSRLELLDQAARVVVDEVSDARVSVQLLAGRVRADVVPRKQRAFRVQCGSVSVEVLGTAFELRREAERTHVSVLRGRVAVHWPDGSTELTAGEAGWFPKARAESAPTAAAGHVPATLPIAPVPGPASAAAPSPAARPLAAPASASASSPTARPRAAPASAAAPSPAARLLAPGDASELVHESTKAAQRPAGARTRGDARKTETHAPSPPDTSWQTQAERGDYARAYALIAAAPEPVPDEVQDLLLAADAARLSGHAAAAVPYLERVVERHAHDPRASLAAFTLGGVLLNQLDRPLQAEAAYARARALALSPALEQDALARQVEASARAGDIARTRELAAEYLHRFPDGRRVQWVRKLSEQ